MTGAAVLAFGGTLAALVGSCGYVVEANRIMLAANLIVLGLAARDRCNPCETPEAQAPGKGSR